MNPKPLHAISQRIDAISEWTGRGVAWLTLGMVLVTFCIVVLRYAFDLGWIWLQESVSYLHAFVFMLGAAYTFKQNGHVRVDIFYQKFSARRKAWTDLLGNLLLVMPLCGFIFFNSWNDVFDSWSRLEGSEETGGLNLVYVLKTIMLLMPVMLGLQSFAIITRNSLFLRNLINTPEEYQQEQTHG